MSEHPGSGPGQSPDEQSRHDLPRHRTPGWVKGFMIAGVLLIVAFAVIHLSGGGMMTHTP
ncbi:hypothetical protein M1E17_21375 [Arthrobacter sp. D1-29]